MNARPSLPKVLQQLRLPIIAAPMFTISYPRLVSAQCKAGIIGSFPALNARPEGVLGEWLRTLKDELCAAAGTAPAYKPMPFAVNLILNEANRRLDHDLHVCLEHQVPIFITSLRAPSSDIVSAVHAYGGVILHDVVNIRHADKALSAGVDGLILVAAGAGGHAGTLSPFALLNEVRRIFKGPVALSGAITSGSDVLAAQVMGADFAYIGTRFIATAEAEASAHYKETVRQATASDIIYTDYFTGVHGNYLRQSIIGAGIDPDKLKKSDHAQGYYGPASSAHRPKSWKDIWGAGQGVGSIHDIPTVAELIDRMSVEYGAAVERVAGLTGHMAAQTETKGR